MHVTVLIRTQPKSEAVENRCNNVVRQTLFNIVNNIVRYSNVTRMASLFVNHRPLLLSINDNLKINHQDSSSFLISCLVLKIFIF